MKIKSLILAMFACSAFVACTNDVVIDEGGQPNANADTYVSVRIALPEASGVGTRADGAAGYESGSVDEYYVEKAYIGIFDKDYNCIGYGVYKTSELGFTTPGAATDNITTTSNKVTVKSGKNPVYAMAVLNADTNPFSVTDGTAAFNNNAVSATIADVATKNKFYMSSSNYAEKTGDTWNKTDGYTKINAENYTTSETANATPITIHVERAVAKVNVSVSGTLDVRGAGYAVPGSSTDVVKLLGWGLNITNKSYFPVKKIQATWDAHNSDDPENVWKSGAWTSAANFRSFWAIDPNYDEASFGSTSPFNTITPAGATTALGKDEYCLENTFIHNYQNTNQTTTAIIKAKYLYEGAEISDDTYLYKIGPEFYKGDVALKTQIVKDLVAMGYYKQDKGAITAADITFTYTNRGYTRIVVEGGVYEADGEAVKEVANFNTKTLYSSGIAAYKNGNCVYPVLIRQFNNTEVPLLSSVNTAAQLGRYGVVRNHVYKLTISAISGIGIPGGDDVIITPPLKPTDPTGPVDPENPGSEIDPVDPIDPTQPATPDDNLNVYIQCKIAILAWAKRVQEVIL